MFEITVYSRVGDIAIFVLCAYIGANLHSHLIGRDFVRIYVRNKVAPKWPRAMLSNVTVLLKAAKCHVVNVTKIALKGQVNAHNWFRVICRELKTPKRVLRQSVRT